MLSYYIDNEQLELLEIPLRTLGKLHLRRPILRVHSRRFIVSFFVIATTCVLCRSAPRCCNTRFYNSVISKSVTGLESSDTIRFCAVLIGRTLGRRMIFYFPASLPSCMQDTHDRTRLGMISSTHVRAVII